MSNQPRARSQFLLGILPYIVIGIGILLRVIVYIQNRSLEVDEANVARNVFERSFSGLLAPLSYQQYAPPGFLWALKAATNIMGYGEAAFRLFPLLCGMLALWLLYMVLRHYVSDKVSWYPLVLMATGYIYLYYTTEVKQYASDTAIALGLLLLALRIDILKTSTAKFISIWLAAALLAMWFSMPSVFILAGTGAYYAYIVFKEKQRTKWPLLIAIYAGWLFMFSAYYFLMLRRGIGSDILKIYHNRYFIQLIPTSTAEMLKTKTLLGDIFISAAGDLSLIVLFNLLLLGVGAVYLFRKHRDKALLVIVPVICLYMAAGLKQFSLVPRVVLFIMPVLLIIIAAGFSRLFEIPNKAVKLVLILVALLNIGNYNKLIYFKEPLYYEEIKDALSEIKLRNIPPEKFHVNLLLQPALVYYTTIHPDKEDWAGLDKAAILPIAGNFDSIAQTFTSDAVLYGWFPEDMLSYQVETFRQYCILKPVEVPGMHLYICNRRQKRF